MVPFWSQITNKRSTERNIHQALDLFDKQKYRWNQWICSNEPCRWPCLLYWKHFLFQIFLFRHASEKSYFYWGFRLYQRESYVTHSKLKFLRLKLRFMVGFLIFIKFNRENIRKYMLQTKLRPWRYTKIPPENQKHSWFHQEYPKYRPVLQKLHQK